MKNIERQDLLAAYYAQNFSEQGKYRQEYGLVEIKRGKGISLLYCRKTHFAQYFKIPGDSRDLAESIRSRLYLVVLAQFRDIFTNMKT